MRILIVGLDGPEPRTTGIRLVVAALADELRKAHEVRYIGYQGPDQQGITEDWIRLVEPPRRPIRGTSLARATLRRRPWEVDHLASGLESVLLEELERFSPDIVHVTSPMLAGLGRLAAGRGSVLTAFDAWHLNVDASLALAPPLRRPLLRAESRRVERFQAHEFESFGRVILVSEQDKSELERLNPALRLGFIPNGVDSDFFAPGDEPAVPGRLVFTGGMYYSPNVVAAEFAARELLPRVRAVRPDAHLVVVGRDPLPRVRELAGLEGVTVTGEVEDVRPWLRSARAFVCPMRSGTGIKNKLLEAMACGCACVSTPLGLQGLEVTPGTHVLAGASADELADELVRVLADDSLAARLGREARVYVRARHSWSVVAREYVRVYAEVVRPCGA